MKKVIAIISLFYISYYVHGQTADYGNNPSAGKYININNAKLYYEVYGQGTPILLLHGDTYGYIDEFSQYIPLLAENFKVIAVGMRGHGKSELGTKSLSYKQFAEDAMAILKKEKHDSTFVMGFSAGAITAYYLAANYPTEIKKAVAIGGITESSGYFPDALKYLSELTADQAEKVLPDLVASRKQLMPSTHTYGNLIDALKKSWIEPVYVEPEKVSRIKCPVLTIGGDRDEYIDPASLVKTHKLIANSQLAVIPNCSHVCLILKPTIVEEIIIPFLSNE